MQPEAVARRSIKSVILLLCEHTVGCSTVENSHKILGNDFVIRAIGNIYLFFRLKFTKNAKDAANSSQEHKICHFLLCEHTVGGFTVVNGHINYLFMCANGQIHLPFWFEWNEFAKDAARSNRLQEDKICHPFALRAHCGT